MSIIVNGTNIPNTGDYIIAGGVNLDKVNVVKNGVTTTVWEKVKDLEVFKPGSLPSIPYEINNGERKWKCTMNHHDTDYWLESGGGVTVSSSYIEMLSTHNYGSSPHSSYSFEQYIQFYYDLTSFKTIKVDFNIHSRVSCENYHYIGFYICILDSLKNELTRSDEIGGSASYPWTTQTLTNYEYSGSLTLNVSSITGNRYVRLLNQISFHCPNNDGGNGDGYVRITSIKFNS